MQRLAVIYFVLLVVGSVLWSTLRTTGLFDLPGDMILHLAGERIGVPFSTAFLIAAVMSGVWRLLEP